MTSELLRSLLDRPDLHWLFRTGEQLARGEAPGVAVEAIRMGRDDSSSETSWTLLRRRDETFGRVGRRPNDGISGTNTR